MWTTAAAAGCAQGLGLDLAQLHSYLVGMKTKNITLKIDEETYQRARIRAARKRTSVSAMVRDFLRAGEEESVDPEVGRIAALRALYRKAERRARAPSSPLEPLKRDDIYAERIR